MKVQGSVPATSPSGVTRGLSAAGSDLRKLLTVPVWVRVQVSRRVAEAGVGDVVACVVVDGREGAAQRWGCGWFVGFEEGAEEPVVKFGVEKATRSPSGVRVQVLVSGRVMRPVEAEAS
jgi:hypothetical protein